uniref:DNA-directed RNA polymerase n=1 Tax=Utricularia reniformis TaxID=192314 RepID=A0A1Y0B1U9_9LAMI|nr:hypothetical protein AEK19_MT0155 [Utricularia reniformis]ART31367.1 hypothetical protein AEK19_MT0155 [Utricularia reniformis]
MKVVESLLSQNAPIYTVHDNFITTSPNVRIVQDIYTEVFINMDHPLVIINNRIKRKIIAPYEAERPPSLDHLDFDDHYRSYFGEQPIPSDYLRDIFHSLLPDNKYQKRWGSKTLSCITTTMQML